MKYTAQDIARILGVSIAGLPEIDITSVSTDTRTITDGKGVLFFAITTANRSGLSYLADAASKGVQVVVADELPDLIPTGMSVVQVEDTVTALQSLAAYHRRQYDIPVIGITGSYGKTIVKEWLSSMLSSSYTVCKSPQSYNSQIGVPLSILQLRAEHTIGVFEVGVSQSGDMAPLSHIVQPTHGIFTTIGSAHDAGFVDRTSKLQEKAALFQSCHQVICSADQEDIVREVSLSASRGRVTTWSIALAADYTVDIMWPRLHLYSNKISLSATTQLSTQLMMDNLIHATVMALEVGVSVTALAAAISAIGPLPMRMETSDGRQGSLLINDTYTADVQSLRLALDYQLSITMGRSRMLILSDIDDSHGPWIEEVQRLIDEYGVDRLIAVGPASRQLSADTATHYTDTAALLADLDRLDVTNEVILIKGARQYRLERVYQQLESLSHNARLEIDLAAIQHNLEVYQRQAGCAMMVVIKASAYGTGSVEVARLLQQRGVAYLAVAFVDEAIVLRRASITMPILVLNPDLDKLSLCSDQDVDIELHSMDQLERVSSHLLAHPTHRLRVHVMLDTGMRRLGFEVSEIDSVRDWLHREDQVELVSIFSHLVASESADFDVFTQGQVAAFDEMCERLPMATYYHILNSSGIARHHHKYNMARLGLGLYGIDSSGLLSTALQPAHHLSARVLQVKHLAAGDSVGYGRSYVADSDMTICTVNVGYADGLIRSASKGGFAFRLGDHLLPVVGSVCMDLTMCAVPADLTVNVGDTVTVFGPDHPIEILARAADTIPYEVLSRIAPRVKRVFHR